MPSETTNPRKSVSDRLDTITDEYDEILATINEDGEQSFSKSEVETLLAPLGRIKKAQEQLDDST